VELSKIKWSDCIELKPLAVGGMASLFLAERNKGAFRKKIVIKKILDEFSKDETVRALFTQEAERHAQLDHPHIVELLDFGSDGDNLYMALEYVSCGNLNAFSRQASGLCGEPRESVALKVLQQIGEALRRVHEQFIHQDLSPANILYAGEGHFKLCDFGLAKEITQENVSSSRLRQGKVRYMAPEQIARSFTDPRSDIFSLGVTVAEFYSGTRLYGDLGPDQLTRLIRSGDYLKHIKSIDLPLSLSEVLFRAVQPAPNDRFQSADELIRALSSEVRTSEVLPSIDTIEVIRPIRARKWSAILSLILTLPTILFLPWLAQYRRSKRSR
jgi:serine/threonine protein kinase